METVPGGIIQERLHLRPDVQDPKPVQGHNIKIPNGFVVFRGIPRRHDDPALRQGVGAEGLVLQKLEHGRRQGL